LPVHVRTQRSESVRKAPTRRKTIAPGVSPGIGDRPSLAAPERRQNLGPTPSSCRPFGALEGRVQASQLPT
jgi:hypothetical protein